MGQRIVALANADPELNVAAALESRQNPALGRDACEGAASGKIGVPIRSELQEHVDVIIDFSTP